MLVDCFIYLPFLNHVLFAVGLVFIYRLVVYLRCPIGLKTLNVFFVQMGFERRHDMT